jgi:quercetin dioxygenase-like cupin family protein
MNNVSYSNYKLVHGLVCNNEEGNHYPSNLYGFTNGKVFHFENNQSTYFGFVSKGTALLHYHDLAIPLKEGMYFCIPGASATLVGGEGIIIEKNNYYGLFSIGGPVEQQGRLKYIDGCTDSLLIPPVKKGDPCLNALFFPANINQTPHQHPSDRVGLIYKGQGQCITPHETIALQAGDLFIIHQDGTHSFKTDAAEELVVIAFHPDSDFGPEDENHPMINRTMVNGQSANSIKGIQTK